MPQWCMSEALDFLVELLDLETIEVNVYRGRHPAEERQRTFGGQVAAQALMAAGRTVEGRRVHSLHSYFLRPGDPTTPILYEVDRIRDGQQLHHAARRRHPARPRDLQHAGELPQRRGEPRAPDRDARGPGARDRCAPLARARRATSGATSTSGSSGMHPIDQRFLGELPWSPNRDREPRQRLWIRADGRAARRPAAARLRDHLRERHEPLRRDPRPAPRSLGRRVVHGCESRPLHVVPPRRCAPTSGSSTTPTRPSPTARAASPAGSSSTRPASSWCPWSRRASRASSIPPSASASQ